MSSASSTNSLRARLRFLTGCSSSSSTPETEAEAEAEAVSALLSLSSLVSKSADFLRLAVRLRGVEGPALRAETEAEGVVPTVFCGEPLRGEAEADADLRGLLGAVVTGVASSPSSFFSKHFDVFVLVVAVT